MSYPLFNVASVPYQQNPSGLLERDELTGWLKNLDREDRANDRAFYWNVSMAADAIVRMAIREPSGACWMGR